MPDLEIIRINTRPAHKLHPALTMEVDQPTSSRPTLKRPHDHEAHSGETPALKKILRNTSASPDPGSGEEEQTSPTVTAARRRKLQRQSNPKSKVAHNALPTLPSTPLFTMHVTPDMITTRDDQTTPQIAIPNDPFVAQPPDPSASTVPDPTDINLEPVSEVEEDDFEWAIDPNAPAIDMANFISAGHDARVEAVTPATREGDWHIIKKDITRPDLEHQSDNPYDFLPSTKLESLARFWRKEFVAPKDLSAMEQRTLGRAEIKKILVKVVSNRPLDNNKKPAWFRAAIISALEQSGVDAQAFAKSHKFIDVKKPGYPWIIIPVSPDVFNALADVRGALDPRSGTLVLFRRWIEVLFPTQHLYAGGIHWEEDIVLREVATADFMEQISESMRVLKFGIEEMTPGRYGDQNDFCTRIKFRFADGQVPFLITPLMLTSQFWTGMGNTKKLRKLNYKWPPKCRLCNSEAHLSRGCPWPGIEISGRKPNFNNCQSHTPGWVEPQLRPKKPYAETTTDFLDIKPTHGKFHGKGEATSKGKKRAAENE